MCGIIGIIKPDSNVTFDIISSLKKMEYRGYDSAGIALINSENQLIIKKEIGKIESLEKAINKDENFVGGIGIGHTRWATHGKVSEINSHPHFTEKVALVHNGIIENYQEIRDKLIKNGYKFKTQTDTEIIVVLITYYFDLGFNNEKAFTSTLDELEGNYAIVAIFNENDNFLACAKRGSPMVIGCDKEKNLYVGSDMFALSNLAEKACYLEDEDYAFLDFKKGIKIFNQGKEISRQYHKIDDSAEEISKSGYETFMIKEILEQANMVGGIVNHYLEIKDKIEFAFPKFKFNLKSLKEINIVACGTSYYAGLTASYYFEKYAGINVNLHIASEFRYRNFNFQKDGVFIFISQSGETADTIAALKYAKENKQHIVSLINAKKSTLESLSEAVIYCHAGQEISVASTKAFTAQLTILMMLALRIGLKKCLISRSEGKKLAESMLSIGGKISLVLQLEEEIEKVAKELSRAKNMIFIGRNIGYGIALEGALKMKELSYIPSDAIAGGELKHGPIALIDNKTPIIALAIPDQNFSKISSNIEELIARDANILLISNKQCIKKFNGGISHSIQIPEIDPFIAPLIYMIPCQFLAYYVAKFLKNDIDQPRNLAKSVTVE